MQAEQEKRGVKAASMAARMALCCSRSGLDGWHRQGRERGRWQLHTAIRYCWVGCEQEWRVYSLEEE